MILSVGCQMQRYGVFAGGTLRIFTMVTMCARENGQHSSTVYLKQWKLALNLHISQVLL